MELGVGKGFEGGERGDDEVKLDLHTVRVKTEQSHVNA